MTEGVCFMGYESNLCEPVRTCAAHSRCKPVRTLSLIRECTGCTPHSDTVENSEYLTNPGTNSQGDLIYGDPHIVTA